MCAFCFIDLITVCSSKINLLHLSCFILHKFLTFYWLILRMWVHVMIGVGLTCWLASWLAWHRNFIIASFFFDTLNVMNVRLCNVVLLRHLELYLFMPLAMTWPHFSWGFGVNVRLFISWLCFFFFFFEMAISLRTLIPRFMPGSVRFPHYARTAA